MQSLRNRDTVPDTSLESTYPIGYRKHGVAHHVLILFIAHESLTGLGFYSQMDAGKVAKEVRYSLNLYHTHRKS